MKGPHFCPKCNSASIVADTRKRGAYIIRRRWCKKERKKHRWTTLELFAYKVRGQGKPAYERVTDRVKLDALKELIAELSAKADDIKSGRSGQIRL